MITKIIKIKFKRVAILLLVVLLLLSGCKSGDNASEPEASCVTEYEYITETVESSDTTQKETSSNVHEESSSMVEPPKTDTVESLITQPEKPTDSGDDNDMDDSCMLIVKGKEIADTPIKLNYEYHYAELPLTTIIKELGAKVEWKDKTTAKIKIHEKNYFLDSIKGSLVAEGDTFNILVVAPGSRHGVFYRTVGNEFIIDSDSAILLLMNIMGAKISIDYDNRIVKIT